MAHILLVRLGNTATLKGSVKEAGSCGPAVCQGRRGNGILVTSQQLPLPLRLVVSPLLDYNLLKDKNLFHHHIKQNF